MIIVPGSSDGLCALMSVLPCSPARIKQVFFSRAEDQFEYFDETIAMN